jgi:hypothetical protein
VTRDEIVFALLVASFAALLTAHAALVAGLAARPPRWRAAAALFAPPLAPYWGGRAGMHARWVAWVASAVAYGVLRVVASR